MGGSWSLSMAVAKYGETASTMLASPSAFSRSIAALILSLTISSATAAS